MIRCTCCQPLYNYGDVRAACYCSAKFSVCLRVSSWVSQPSLASKPCSNSNCTHAIHSNSHLHDTLSAHQVVGDNNTALDIGSLHGLVVMFPQCLVVNLCYKCRLVRGMLHVSLIAVCYNLTYKWRLASGLACLLQPSCCCLVDGSRQDLQIERVPTSTIQSAPGDE